MEEGSARQPITIIPDSCKEADASLLGVVPHTSPICQPLEIIKDKNITEKTTYVRGKLRRLLREKSRTDCVNEDESNESEVAALRDTESKLPQDLDKSDTLDKEKVGRTKAKSSPWRKSPRLIEQETGNSKCADNTDEDVDVTGDCDVPDFSESEPEEGSHSVDSRSKEMQNLEQSSIELCDLSKPGKKKSKENKTTDRDNDTNDSHTTLKAQEQDLSQMSVLERVEAVFGRSTQADEEPCASTISKCRESTKVYESKTTNRDTKSKDKRQQRTILLSSESENDDEPVFTRVTVQNPIVMHYVPPREGDSPAASIGNTDDDDDEAIPDPFDTPVQSPNPNTEGKMERGIQCMLIGEPLEKFRPEDNIENRTDEHV